MDFLKWLLQGIAEIWMLAVAWLTPVVQRLFSAFGMSIDAVAAQFLAALLLLGLVAWLVRKVFWGKPKMFEPQKVIIKTEKSPLSVVFGDVMHWVVWGILLGLGLVAAVAAVSEGLWFSPP